MLTVKTGIGLSAIHGIGLFAATHILKGTMVWRYNSYIDLVISKEALTTLSEFSLSQIKKYAYLDRHSKKYVLCGDDARFFNHATFPNCDDSMQDITFAARDIAYGEELTIDYSTLDEEFAGMNSYGLSSGDDRASA